MNIQIKKAVELFKTQKNLAEAINKASGGKKCRQGHVNHWLKDRRKPSAFYSLAIEKATNGEVKAADLRPDIFKFDE